MNLPMAVKSGNWLIKKLGKLASGSDEVRVLSHRAIEKMKQEIND